MCRREVWSVGRLINISEEHTASYSGYMTKIQADYDGNTHLLNNGTLHTGQYKGHKDSTPALHFKGRRSGELLSQLRVFAVLVSPSKQMSR